MRTNINGATVMALFLLFVSRICFGQIVPEEENPNVWTYQNPPSAYRAEIKKVVTERFTMYSIDFNSPRGFGAIDTVDAIKSILYIKSKGKVSLIITLKDGTDYLYAGNEIDTYVTFKPKGKKYMQQYQFVPTGTKAIKPEQMQNLWIKNEIFQIALDKFISISYPSFGKR